MKTKILGGIVAVVIAAIAAVNVNVNNEAESSLSAISLANVEALANGEEEEGKTCYNSITTKEGSQVLYCQSCSWVDGTSTWYSGTDKC